MRRKGTIMLKAKNAPIVELDSEAHAAYVRFSSEKIVQTKPVVTDECIVTVDFDSNGEVVGVELVGVSEFGVESLLKISGIKAPSKNILEKTRYVAASLQTA